MRRILCPPREDWQAEIAKAGIVFSETVLPTGDIRHYWREGAYYEFTDDEVANLKEASAIIFEMLVAAGDHIVNMEPTARTAFMRDKMRIPEYAHKAILRTWGDEPACQSVYGRYDFAYMDPFVPPKLYEFNAQTPTCLVEAAWAQYMWLEQTKVGDDQWNALWDTLIEAWKRNLLEIGNKFLRFDGNSDRAEKPTIYFAYSNGETSGEDVMNVTYLADACNEAGYNVRVICVEDIKLGFDGRFYVPKAELCTSINEVIPEHEDYATEDLEHLDVCFFLYPYEFVWEGNQDWAKAMFADMENVGKFDADGKYVGGTVWFEAPYKMLWSNKAILPVLWDLFKDDPYKSQYLIPSWFVGDKPKSVRDWVEKPIFAREGASIKIYRNGKLDHETAGDYGSNDRNDYIVQELWAPPEFEDHNGQQLHTITGVWMIDGEPAGMGLREDDTLVTTNLGYFVPHIVTPELERKT